METFKWVPSPNMSEKAEPNVKVISLGDGYQQRQKNGINNDLRSYSVTFKTTNAEALLIDEFLTKQGAVKPFLWLHPTKKKQVIIKCPSWSSTINNTSATITATFEEVVA